MRPNIVYLHSHDTGRYVQPMGHSVPTPNLQRLAEQGVLFRQAFCAAPTCAPSRAALLTGQSAHSSGMLGLAHRGFALTDYAQHLVTSLNATGYRTILAGMQHVAAGEDGPEVIGYDEELVLGRGETGSRAASPIWVDYMRTALKGLPSRDFEVPEGIVFQRIDRETGLVAGTTDRNSYFQPFLENTEPTMARSAISTATDTRRALRDDAF